MQSHRLISNSVRVLLPFSVVSFIWVSLSLPFWLFKCTSLPFGEHLAFIGPFNYSLLAKGLSISPWVSRSSPQILTTTTIMTSSTHLRILFYHTSCQVSRMFCSRCHESHTRLHCLIISAATTIRHAIISLCLSRSHPRSVSPYPSRGIKESCKSICIRHLTSISHVLGEWHHLLLRSFVERR